MSLISESFLLFTILLILSYYLIPKRFQWICLLLFSLYFYLVSSGKTIIFILITSVSAYVCAALIGKVQTKTKQYIKNNKEHLSKEEKTIYKKKQNSICKIFMIVALLINVGLLCLFKYSDFILGQFKLLIPVDGIPTSLNLIVPLGISFYTFQTIGYVVDVYWEKIEPQKNYFKLLLFVSFFPQVTQGPISDYNQLSSQLFSSHQFDYKNFSFGCQRMLWGFYKKMVIADRLAPLLQTAFSEYSFMNGNNVLFSAFLYSLHIYADFSGYMDIVCGLCEILDIRLTENFMRPYFSKSVAEYWRRWHISLGTWFKTYIYYPVAVSKFSMKCSSVATSWFGKNVGKTTGASIALIIVWFTTGFWHGASWSYIIWGGLNGVAIILSLWFEPLFDKTKKLFNINESSFGWRAFATLRTFFIVTMIKVFPEVGDFRAGISFWKHCFTNWTVHFNNLSELFYPIISKKDLLIILVGAISIFIISLLQRKQSVRERISHLPAFTRYAIFLIIFFLIIICGVPTQNGGGFLYEQF